MPQPIVVITAHGQPSAPAPAEAELAIVAAAVASHLPGWDIRSATLSSPGRLEDMVAPGALVYPFFMSQGWFTSKVLPERLSDRNCHILSPFGLDPQLPELAAQAVLQTASERGWPQDDWHLLLAAHGSARGPRAAEAAEAFADALRPYLPNTPVTLGYVEQAPRIFEAAKDLPTHSLCLPFFAQAGDHVKQDIPEALSQARFEGPRLPVTGALPGVSALIARSLRNAHQNRSS